MSVLKYEAFAPKNKKSFEWEQHVQIFTYY